MGNMFSCKFALVFFEDINTYAITISREFNTFEY